MINLQPFLWRSTSRNSLSTRASCKWSQCKRYTMKGRRFVCIRVSTTVWDRWTGSYRFDKEFGVDSSEQGGRLGAPQSRSPVTFPPGLLVHFGGLLVWHVLVKCIFANLVRKPRGNQKEERTGVTPDMVGARVGQPFVTCQQGYEEFQDGKSLRSMYREKTTAPSAGISGELHGGSCSVTRDQEGAQSASWWDKSSRPSVPPAK